MKGFTELTREDCVKLERASIILAIIMLGINPILLLTNHPLGIPILSFGVALVSISLGFHSVKISLGSDEKMKAFSNIYFSEVLQHLGDYRTKTIPEPNDTPYTYSIRNNFEKYKHELNKTIILKKWIDVRRQKELVMNFIVFVKDLPLDLIQTVDKMDILIMIANIRGFGLYEDELRELVETYFGEKRKEEELDFDTLFLTSMKELTERHLDGNAL